MNERNESVREKSAIVIRARAREFSHFIVTLAKYLRRDKLDTRRGKGRKEEGGMGGVLNVRECGCTEPSRRCFTRAIEITSQHAAKQSNASPLLDVHMRSLLFEIMLSTSPVPWSKIHMFVTN